MSYYTEGEADVRRYTYTLRMTGYRQDHAQGWHGQPSPCCQMAREALLPAGRSVACTSLAAPLEGRLQLTLRRGGGA